MIIISFLMIILMNLMTNYKMYFYTIEEYEDQDSSVIYLMSVEYILQNNFKNLFQKCLCVKNIIFKK